MPTSPDMNAQRLFSNLAADEKTPPPRFSELAFAEPDPTPCLRTKSTLAMDSQRDNFVKSRIAEI
jgi:hypothetical protein